MTHTGLGSVPAVCASDMAPRRLIRMGRFGVHRVRGVAATRRKIHRRIQGGSLGGDGQARTADPLLAKQVLSQLSYIPGGWAWWAFLDSNQRPHGYQPCALTN